MKIERLMTTTISKHDTGELEIRATVRLVDLERLEGALRTLARILAYEDMRPPRKDFDFPREDRSEIHKWIQHALANPTEEVEG